jgi:hypothetical protein
MQRGAFLAAGLGESERAGIEVERGEDAFAAGSGVPLAPVQASGDHQVKDKPKIVVEADGDALPDAAESGYGVAEGRVERRVCCSQQEGACDLDPLEDPSENTALERFYVHDDVGEFGHSDLPGSRAQPIK